MALKAAVYLTALGPQGLKETAELCTRKANYTASQLTQLEGVSLRFDRPFFKEFTLKVQGKVPRLLQGLLAGGYHAGLALGRWYPSLGNCVSVAVTEKRTLAEIDGLVRDWDRVRSLAQADALIENAKLRTAADAVSTQPRRKSKGA